MAADDAEYREFCRKLEAFGIDRKALGAAMGRDRSAITRWLNQTRKRKINADEIKKFGAYLDKLAALLERRPDRYKSAKESPPLERRPA